ncbi:MAG: hypothetical protein DHS20C20_33700 [Ardenticatenaceae bacterium]|nr:MAG: hypothetical protein DHS20C20_33700 [Ardenticatenaceae bacterium]
MADDLLSSLDQLDKTPLVLDHEPEDGWYTSKQIREKLGWGAGKTHENIKRGLSMGIYEMKKFPTKNTAGQIYYQPRYRLAQEDESGQGGD